MLAPLYAILDVDILTTRDLEPLEVLSAWLDAGVRLVQLRAKSLGAGSFVTLADTIASQCRTAGATFIVNDRADVAAMSGADGVHVGQEDLLPADVRRIVGPTSIVGQSTHNELQVERALAQPIDYLAIGPVFQTTSKESAWPEVGLIGVRRAVEQSAGRLPVVAIGGITIDHARAVIDAGATSVAVISDLLVGPVADRAREYLRALA